MFLETERLILRKITEEDFTDFCDFAMDEEMSLMMGRDIMHTPEEARPTFDWLLHKEERCYVLVLKETGRAIGNLSVCNVQKALSEFGPLNGRQGKALSFSISRHYQRRGLMTEAVNAVIDRLFTAEELYYIQCGYFPFNKASEQLQKKLGFRYLVGQRFFGEGFEIVTVENVLWREDWEDMQQ